LGWFTTIKQLAPSAMWLCKVASLLLLGLMVVACLWSTSDAVVQVAWRSDDFVGTIGFNTHFHYSNICYNEGYERFKALFLALGARHIRDSLLNTSTHQPLHSLSCGCGLFGVALLALSRQLGKRTTIA
jgi:hypothetical protein